MAIGLGSWGAKALGLGVLSSGSSHCCPHHRLHIAPGLTCRVQQDVRWVVGFQAERRQGCLSQTWRGAHPTGRWARRGGSLHLLKGLLVAVQMRLFGSPSRIEGDGESQLRGDTLDRGTNPRATGGRGFWRLVLILSIAGCPPPERGGRLCRLLLPSLHPCYPVGYQPLQVQWLLVWSAGWV